MVRPLACLIAKPMRSAMPCRDSEICNRSESLLSTQSRHWQAVRFPTHCGRPLAMYCPETPGRGVVMKPIIIVMLCVQIGVLLATIFAVAVRKPTAAKPAPVWSSFAISLFVVGMTSNTIAGDHRGAPGADVVSFGGPFLIGMGLMAALLLISQRRAGIESRR